MNMRVLFVRVLVASLVGLIYLSDLRSANGGLLRKVVATGDAVPGTLSAQFTQVGEATIGPDGMITFVARGSEEFDAALWSEESGTLRLVMGQGRAVVGDPDGSVSWLIDPEDSDDRRYQFLLATGEVIAHAATAAGVADGRVWRFNMQPTAQLVVAAGKLAPESVEEFYQFQLQDINAYGDAVIQATSRLSGELDVERYSAWTSRRDGTFSLLAKSGQSIQGVGESLMVDDLWFPNSAINQHGEVALAIEVTTTPALNSISSNSRFAILRGTNADNLEVLALADAMNVSTAISTGYITSIDLNNVGDVAFGQDHAVWLHRAGNLEQVISNDAHVMLNARTGFLSHFQNVRIADDSTVTVAATFGTDDAITPPQSFATIWKQSATGLIPIAYPGLDVGSLIFEAVDGDFDRNDGGQIATLARVRHADASDAGSVLSMLAQDTTGTWHTIVRVGEQLEVNPGDFRTVWSISSRDGRKMINDSGQIIVSLYFTDGSGGIFVSNAVAIPEPQSVIGLMIGALFLRRKWLVVRK